MPRKTPSFIPIYRRLADSYKEAILKLQYKPGDRVHSITELQERHSVSRETAKLVLKILADEGLVVQKAGKGSFIADVRKPLKMWGIILPFYSVLYEEILQHLRLQAQLAGCELQHFVSHNNWQDEIRLVGQLIADRYEAIVVVPTLDESRTAAFYRRLKSRNTVLVLMDHTMTGSFFSYVIQSYDLGVKRGMEYLLSTTTQSLAFVRNEVWAGRNLVQELMEETFKHLMEQHRPAAQPIIVETLDRIDADYLRSTGVEGLFCCDDTCAIRAIGRLRDQGVRIPGDMRIVSYGNTDLARYFTPALTAIDCHTAEMAERTAEIITTKLHGGVVSDCQYVIQPDLVIRET